LTLLVFALLPRALLAHATLKSLVLFLGGGALVINTYAAASAAGDLLDLGPWLFVGAAMVVALLTVFLFEVSGNVARILALRDVLLLITAVVIGLLLFHYLSGLISLLFDFFIGWLGLHTATQYRILDAAGYSLLAAIVGFSLVLIATPMAQDARRLGNYLAVSLPLMYLVGIVSSLSVIFSLREALILTARDFVIVGLAFSTGCLLASTIVARQRLLP
jgi:hypothetical protein